MRIIFAGTPDFSVPPLKALLDSEHQVIAVYTQPDRPAGRGRKLTPSPVKAEALAHDINVYQPLNFKQEEDLQQLEALQADLMVVVAYGLILPQRVLDAPQLGCINIHASILPRWRGAAPIQRAIAAGDDKTGITIMQMEAGLDTGPMYLINEIPITTEETGASLHDKLAQLGAESLLEALPEIGQVQPQVQDDNQATYAHKLTKEEALINWQQSSQQIDQLVRAFNPWPVAQTRWLDKQLRVWQGKVLSDQHSKEPGTVVRSHKEGINIACGAGIYRITMLQMPGKKAMAVKDFLNAHSLDGVKFE